MKNKMQSKGSSRVQTDDIIRRSLNLSKDSYEKIEKLEIFIYCLYKEIFKEFLKVFM